MKITSIFKKTAVFSLAMTLILLMAISVMPLASAADEEISAGFETSATEGETAFGEKLVAMNVSQSGNIKMLFYFTFDNSTLDADDYIEITIPQLKKEAKVMKIAKGDLKDAGNGRYLVEVPVAAAQQTDLVSLQWFKSDDGTVTSGKIRKYSVRYYADRVLNLAKDEEKASESNSETVKKYSNQVNNVISMLNYGAMAQKMFNYNDGTDGEARLANAGLFGESNPIDNMTAANMIGVTTSEKPEPANGVEFLHSQAFLQDTVQLRVYFNAPEGATAKLKRNDEYVGGDDNPTEFKIWTEEGTGYRYVNINNVAAHNFDVKFTVEINVDGKATSMDCSVLEYALRALESYKTTDEQKDTARAIYLYYAWMKNYVTNDTFKPGKTDSEGNEIVCNHERSHIEIDKVVCSDCGYTGYATRLSLTANPVELIENEPTDVAFTIKVDNATDLQALIITLTPDDSDKVTLTFKSMVLGDGSSQTPIEGTANLNVVLDSSEPINGSATLATVVYTVNASESGTYKITPTVREATNSSKTDISSTIATSMVTLVVKEPACEEHTVEYDITAEGHRGYCDKCQRVFDAVKHTEKGTWSSADKLYTFACSVCNHKLYTSDMVYKTEANTSDSAGSKDSFLTVSQEDGFVRYTPKASASDPYFYPFSTGGGQVTGQYLVIKYRVSNNEIDMTTSRPFAGSLAGGTTGASGKNGDDSNSWGTSTTLYADGEWHFLIVTPNIGTNLVFTANADGTYNWRWFRMNLNDFAAFDGSCYFDIDEIAFADTAEAASYYVYKNDTTRKNFHYTFNLDVGNNMLNGATFLPKAQQTTKTITIDMSQYAALETPTSLTIGGWTCVTGGVASYKVRVTSVDGVAVENPTLVNWLGGINRSDIYTAYGKTNGFNADCQLGAGMGEGGGTVVDLTAYACHKVDFEIVAITRFGGEELVAVKCTNVAVPCPNNVIVDVEAKASTCTTPGNEAYKTCENCGRIYNTNSEEIDAIPTLELDPTAHNKVDKTWTAPTNTEDGWYAHTACENGCGKAWNAEGEEIDAPIIPKIVPTTNKYIGYQDMKGWTNLSTSVDCKPSEDRSYVRFERNAACSDVYALFLSGNTTSVTGQYMVFKYRTDHVTSFEFFVNTEGGVDGAACFSKSGFQADEQWHIAIVDLATGMANKGDYFKAETDGTYIVQSARIDLLNASASEGYVDFGFIALTDDLSKIGSILLDGDENYCPHKVADNAVWTLDENDPMFEKTDCVICGGKVERYVSNTPDDLTMFTPDEIKNKAGGWSNGTVTVLEDENGIPYVQFEATKAITTEQTVHLYSDTNTPVTNIGKYVAILWRSTNSTAIEVVVDSKASSVKSNVLSLGAPNANNEWTFSVKDYNAFNNTTAGGYFDGESFTAFRLDWINNTAAVGDTRDIAFIAYFDTAAEAYAYYAQYVKAYDINCEHFTTTTAYDSNTQLLITTCDTCGTVTETKACDHAKITAAWNSAQKIYTLTCDYCGNVETKDMVYKSEAYSNGTVGSSSNFITATTGTDEDGETYVRYTPSKSASDPFFYPWMGNTANVTGQFMVIKYRLTNNGTNMTTGAPFASSQAHGRGSAVGDSGDSQNVWFTSTTLYADGKWHYLMVAPNTTLNLTFTANEDGTYTWKYLRMKLNGFAAYDGSCYFDIAEVAFADNEDAAFAYAGIDTTYCVAHFDALKVDNKTVASVPANTTNTYMVEDMEAETLTATNSISAGGWFVTPGGVSSYKIRVIEVNDTAVTNPTLVGGVTSSSCGVTDGVTKVGTGQGYATTCGIGARYTAASINLSAYAGSKVDFEIVAITNFGEEIIVARFINVNVPAAE